MSYKVIVFQGPSGSGKITPQVRLGLPKVITWTSRVPRVGEINGVDYHFASEEQMLSMNDEH